MTIKETWENCIKQWEWIVAILEQYPDIPVHQLKTVWMKQNGFGFSIDQNCFFCYKVHWDMRDTKDCNFDSTGWEVCKKCPGYLIDNNFYCMNKEYRFDEEPQKFLVELHRLYKIWEKKT